MVPVLRKAVDGRPTAARSKRQAKRRVLVAAEEALLEEGGDDRLPVRTR